jgi:Na+/melibiose symporter-like transporter
MRERSRPSTLKFLQFGQHLQSRASVRMALTVSAFDPESPPPDSSPSDQAASTHSASDAIAVSTNSNPVSTPQNPTMPQGLEPLLRFFKTRFAWSNNYSVGVLNGWFVFLGDGFLNAGLVLSSFAAALNAPNWVIGLLPAIAVGGWLLPQVLVGAAVRHVPRKVDVYRRASLVRTSAYIVMVVSSFLFAGNPSLLLTTFLLALIANSISSGVSGLPWLESVAKTIPPKARSGFFGVRNLWGGLLGLGAGFAVRAILGSSLVFPWDYTLIFLLGGIAYTVGYWFFGLTDEPPDPPRARANLWDDLIDIPKTIKTDPKLRAFISFRLLFAAGTIGDAFFTAHALRNIGIDKSAIGNFLIAVGIIAPLSNAIWTRVAQRFGSRRIIRISLGFAIAAPLVALLMPKGAGTWFALVFMCQAVASAGLNLANANYLLSLAPVEARGRYIGTVNTLVGVAVFTPIIGGWIADTSGYTTVFAIGAVLYLIAYVRAGRLERDL